MIEFLATLAPIQSAIMLHGSGNGLQVKLEIPETEVQNAIALAALTQQVLRVTVEVVEKPNGEDEDYGL
jgi:hypothetical protein